VVRTTILDDTTGAKKTAQHWARETEAKIGTEVSMWWADRSRSDDGQVGAAALCTDGNRWRSRRSYLGTGHMEVCDAKLWAIRLVHDVMIGTRAALQSIG